MNKKMPDHQTFSALPSSLAVGWQQVPCGMTTEPCYPSVVITQKFSERTRMPDSKLDLLQGTLDLMVLQTLDAMGALHGYGIARRIEQVSGDAILLNQGTIYASLVRLQQQAWISAEWGTSDNNRKAKFYSITKRGRRQLSEDTAYWQRLAGVIGRVLALGGATNHK
jgi:transcriptional regulator